VLCVVCVTPEFLGVGINGKRMPEIRKTANAEWLFAGI